MKARICSSAILAALALVSAAFAADTYSVAQKPKKDDVHKYAMKADADVNGVTIHADMSWTETTTNIDPDGSFTVLNTPVELKLTFNGNETDNPPGPPMTTVYKPTGEVSKISETSATPGAAEYRMANLESLVDPGKPLNIGDSWSHDFKADPTTGAVAAKGDYKLLGEEKIGNYNTLKVQFSVKEQAGDTPAGCDGTVWVDKTDGTLVKGQFKWTKAPLPMVPLPVDATIELNRT